MTFVSSSKPVNDQELIALLREGNAAAYTELFDRYQPILYVYARKSTGDRDTAADIVQDVFISLWDKRESFRYEASLLTYLYSAVRYQFFNLLDKQKVRADYAASLQQDAAEGSPMTDNYMREKEMSRLIEQAVDALPANLREVFLLSQRANMTAAEIAELYGVSEKTIKNRLSLAIKQLRLKLNLMGIVPIGMSIDLFLEILKKK
ncbi:RNA polymerase sigma factor [Mucilaginibacter sp. E4BP6]|uniref:RNA polymerase sigma factor n=1 Tax=Mucilaginibacter sp. E4BP6 TaxID=2723089 RepID=UPI0015C867A3|nr:RNA polymerase sigma-70 factor [Mucilaginibacter sp. E4BP6]NYE66999.1 RNA polymerase sigma-70 factor (ECF subfamily) [Mucilaginibacter sp. E4BP6]